MGWPSLMSLVNFIIFRGMDPDPYSITGACSHINIQSI